MAAWPWIAMTRMRIDVEFRVHVGVFGPRAAVVRTGKKDYYFIRIVIITRSYVIALGTEMISG